ncbi:hypothetical protein Taro_053289 [Colocasia esculenta]|uniref:Uncharacterized protein n=1 Tax=Colocasia esculenta TaxID=4460 RepID=A0A843XM70_COLES|nr:hypothetical protein [Colocasia esculenta]
MWSSSTSLCIDPETCMEFLAFKAFGIVSAPGDAIPVPGFTSAFTDAILLIVTMSLGAISSLTSQPARGPSRPPGSQSLSVSRNKPLRTSIQMDKGGKAAYKLFRSMKLQKKETKLGQTRNIKVLLVVMVIFDVERFV